MNRIRSFIENLTQRFRKNPSIPEATAEEIEAYFAEQERQRAEAQREYEEERARQYEQERLDEEWGEEQAHYRSYCPHCGTRKVYGRCPACDRAFGRN